jgi:hypothetical protein
LVSRYRFTFSSYDLRAMSMPRTNHMKY